MAVLVALTSGLLLAADKPKANDAKMDMQALQGTWQVVSGEAAGQAAPAAAVKGAELAIKGDGYSFMMKGQVAEAGTFKLDTTTKPVQMDFTITTGPNKGKTQLGICQLDGASFKVCLAHPGAPRPTAFSTKKGDQNELTVLTREKP